MAKWVRGRSRGKTCRACGWWQFLTVAFNLDAHLSFHLQFFIIIRNTSIPFTKMLNSVSSHKESSEKFTTLSFPVWNCVEASQFRSCTQRLVKREVSWDHKELYLRDNVLLSAAPKTDSGTRAMSGVTDLLLNLQCSERSASTHKHSKFNVERVFSMVTCWICNVRKWA